MTDRARQKRRNIFLALVLALVALAFYFGFILVNVQGGG
jgi:hypothetical protein